MTLKFDFQQNEVSFFFFLSHLSALSCIFDFDDIQNAMDKSISDKANIVKAVVKIAEATKV